jgi:hypothetical protein
MKQNYLKIAVVTIAAVIIATSCGSGKRAIVNVRIELEECEKLALEKSENWRAAGNEISSWESAVRQAAEVKASGQLTKQLNEQINMVIKDGNTTGEMYQPRNLKTICHNIYKREDGRYNAYVCIEMDKENLSSIYQQLIDNKRLADDFGEHRFKQEMEKVKEDLMGNVGEEYLKRHAISSGLTERLFKKEMEKEKKKIEKKKKMIEKEMMERIKEKMEKIKEDLMENVKEDYRHVISISYSLPADAYSKKEEYLNQHVISISFNERQFKKKMEKEKKKIERQKRRAGSGSSGKG